ncbi:MAG: hypothetical protein COB15_17235, partial [Flavobacteriales bacterium]
EVWYLRSVETKNYIAEFNLSDRKDAIGVVDENGGVSTSAGQQLKKLDNIKLYTKQELLINPSTPTPIKVVHFEYNYSLCQNVFNNNGSQSLTASEISNAGRGKLTLKHIYFTYGNSKKGQLNPYEFHYADSDHDRTPETALNPSYNVKGYDRWGTYKKQPGGLSCGNSVPPLTGNLSNDEFPYTEQSSNTDEYAAAWCLSTIDLPSGGVLNIDYESDDYAYVQNKRAQQMYKVAGTSDGYGSTISNSLAQVNNFIVVEVPNGTTVGDILGAENMSKIYFKFLVNILKNSNGVQNYDYVPGYARFYGAQIHTISGVTYVYIQVNKETYNDDGGGDDCHPISKAAFQMVRSYLSRVLYPANSNTGFSPSTFSNILSNFLTDAKTLVKGINKTLAGKGIAETFIPSKSFVRLQNIEGNKKGGGIRVSKITMNDSWDSMVSSETNTEYGQTYSYSLDGTMSSGVASYEPLVGGDENPFRKPMPYEVERSFYDNDVMFQEEPYGESLFPSATVIYSKVTVKNIERIDVDDLDTDGDSGELLVRRNATGRTEYEFYTAKDFPIIRKQTGMTKKVIKPSFLNQMFSKKHTYRFAASQGYLVELNNMHGKAKSKKTFAEGGVAAIEGIEYNYKRNGDKLVNNVDVINAKNQITNKVIGEEIDMVIDSRHQKSKTTATTTQSGIDAFFLGPWFVPIPSLWVLQSRTLREFKSSVSTKVIQKYGILDNVVVYDQNSKVTTYNKLYDEGTGKVLLTETINEFDDPLYAFNYPAHWVYEGMEQASKNIGARVSISTNGAGLITSNTSNLTPGDELIYGGSKIWITSDEATGSLYAIDEVGAVVTITNKTYKIIRSGKRNLHSLSVGDVVSRTPLISGNSIIPSAVLNANAIEYTDKWGAASFNKDVYTGGCGRDTRPPPDLICVDDAAQINYLETFLNDMLASNSNGKFLFHSGYTMDFIGVTTPMFGTPNYADLKVCAATLTTSLTNPNSHKLFFNIENIAGPTVYASFINGVVWPGVGICPYYEILKIKLSGVLDPAHTMHDIVSFDVLSAISQNTFTIRAEFPNGSGGSLYKYLNGYVMSRTVNVDLQTCTPKHNPENCIEELVVNPYVKGLRGNYKANKSYAYNADRNQSYADIRKDGGLNIAPFWGYNAGQTSWNSIFNPLHPNYNPGVTDVPWVMNSEVTKCSPFSNQLESKDALGRFSAAQYGYNNTMAIAEIFNSKYNNFGFNGFEDYEYYATNCIKDHLKWAACWVSNSDAHTGRYSYAIPQNKSAFLSVPITVGNNCVAAVHSAPYNRTCEDDNGVFQPESGKKYIFSCWIKEQNVPPEILVYNEPIIYLSGTTNLGAPNSSILTINSAKYSNIIDGWQKVEYVFEISTTAVVGDKMEIYLGNTSSNIVYYDDMRIQPFNSTMNSYVYDPVSLRLWAELDDRNFATFYEYDEEGTLVRVKKETEKGIKTIQENRAGVKK